MDQIIEANRHMESERGIGKIVVLMAVTLLLRSAASAEVQSRAPAAGGATAALLLCCEADQLSGPERQRILMRGLELAQDAAAADPSDAQAHFAVFCNLGKQVQSRAFDPRDLGVIGHLRRELDTALALAPEDADALAAKGAMLLALPWFLGGDRHHGEELLRRVLIKDPRNAAARTYLADALRSRGAAEEARALQMLDVSAAPSDGVCARFARAAAQPVAHSLSCRDVLPTGCWRKGGKTE